MKEINNWIKLKAHLMKWFNFLFISHSNRSFIHFFTDDCVVSELFHINITSYSLIKKKKKTKLYNCYYYDFSVNLNRFNLFVLSLTTTILTSLFFTHIHICLEWTTVSELVKFFFNFTMVFCFLCNVHQCFFFVLFFTKKGRLTLHNSQFHRNCLQITFCHSTNTCTKWPQEKK